MESRNAETLGEKRERWRDIRQRKAWAKVWKDEAENGARKEWDTGQVCSDGEGKNEKCLPSGSSPPEGRPGLGGPKRAQGGGSGPLRGKTVSWGQASGTWWLCPRPSPLGCIITWHDSFSSVSWELAQSTLPVTQTRHYYFFVLFTISQTSLSAVPGVACMEGGLVITRSLLQCCDVPSICSAPVPPSTSRGWPCSFHSPPVPISLFLFEGQLLPQVWGSRAQASLCAEKKPGLLRSGAWCCGWGWEAWRWLFSVPGLRVIISKLAAIILDGPTSWNHCEGQQETVSVKVWVKHQAPYKHKGPRDSG